MTLAHLIRPARAADMPGLAAIYNDVLTTSTTIFSDKPVTAEDRKAWFETRVAAGFPVFVADAGGEVAGFASYAEFRAWPGYRHSIEHSIHVHRDHRGSGIGRELMQALFARAQEQNMHVMVAGVDAANVSGIAFHKRLGFAQVGRLSEVGRKFGRWLDLVFLQKFIDAPGTPRA